MLALSPRTDWCCYEMTTDARTTFEVSTPRTVRGEKRRAEFTGRNSDRQLRATLPNPELVTSGALRQVVRTGMEKGKAKEEIDSCPQEEMKGPAQSANNVYSAWPGGE